MCSWGPTPTALDIRVSVIRSLNRVRCNHGRERPGLEGSVSSSNTEAIRFPFCYSAGSERTAGGDQGLVLPLGKYLGQKDCPPGPLRTTILSQRTGEELRDKHLSSITLGKCRGHAAMVDLGGRGQPINQPIWRPGVRHTMVHSWPGHPSVV